MNNKDKFLIPLNIVAILYFCLVGSFNIENKLLVDMLTLILLIVSIAFLVGGIIYRIKRNSYLLLMINIIQIAISFGAIQISIVTYGYSDVYGYNTDCILSIINTFIVFIFVAMWFIGRYLIKNVERHNDNALLYKIVGIIALLFSIVASISTLYFDIFDEYYIRQNYLVPIIFIALFTIFGMYILLAYRLNKPILCHIFIGGVILYAILILLINIIRDDVVGSTVLVSLSIIIILAGISYFVLVFSKRGKNFVQKINLLLSDKNIDENDLIIKRLQILNELKLQNKITEEIYQIEKQKILGGKKNV